MRSLFAVVFFAAGVARADAPVLVYVNDVVAADAGSAGDASALTSALCAALAKDKRVDVLCAPDVKQLVAFAASSSMFGATSPAVESLQRRVESTRFVVSAQVIAGKGTTTLTTTIGVKDDTAQIGAMTASTAITTVEEASTTKATTFLERIPRVAGRLVDAALAPTALAPTGPSSTTPPPAPLSTTTTAPPPATTTPTPTNKKQ